MTEFPPIPVNDTVLVITHMQNDFAHRDGRGAEIAFRYLDESGTLKRIKSVLQACRHAGIPVIFHNETFRPGHPELRERRQGYCRGTARVLGVVEGNMAVRGEWGSEVIDELKPDLTREEYVVHNAKVDPFTCSEFEVILRNIGRNILIIVGLACDFGIQMTARSGNEREYGICVLSDCVDRFLGDYSERTLTDLLPIYGRVSTSDIIIEEISAG
ncbi:cysteine hydrolase family protein [Aquisediminimonas sediminicola]|uniref:cysteine hydrolase family protein n=1 Tax=Alteraquisediminimonas sediminicola TaxID=2676787 RepID=UPI001C8E8A44|nr:cysteine hydrolase [Aquisediminimonas sediminicola]